MQFLLIFQDIVFLFVLLFFLQVAGLIGTIIATLIIVYQKKKALLFNPYLFFAMTFGIFAFLMLVIDALIWDFNLTVESPKFVQQV